jgi:hypothetical protein
MFYSDFQRIISILFHSDFNIVIPVQHSLLNRTRPKKKTCVFLNILEINIFFTWFMQDKDLTLMILVQKMTISFTVDTKN